VSNELLLLLLLLLSLLLLFVVSEGAIFFSNFIVFTRNGHEVSGFKTLTLQMNIDQRWNDIGRAKPKHLLKNLSQRHSFYHKYHMGWPGSKWASVVRGWRVTALAMARSQKVEIHLNFI
jgi:hypothetical protein